MRVSSTILDGVLLIQLDIFEDHRGQYIEIYNDKAYREKGVDIKFVCDDIIISDRNVLRGIHGDSETWKLISCLRGRFYLVVVNCDIDSKDFGQWQSFVLSPANGLQVLVPPKYGNGHLVLSDKAIFHYKQSSYYGVERQFTYRFDEPRFGIWWPTRAPILSQRDDSAR